jgi:excisionase family DNA binding protein
MTTAIKAHEKLLTVSDAAEILACSKSSIYSLLQARRLRYFRLKGIGDVRANVRIPASAIEQYLKTAEISAVE